MVNYQNSECTIAIILIVISFQLFIFDQITFNNNFGIDNSNCLHFINEFTFNTSLKLIFHFIKVHWNESIYNNSFVLNE